MNANRITTWPNLFSFLLVVVRFHVVLVWDYFTLDILIFPFHCFFVHSLLVLFLHSYGIVVNKFTALTCPTLKVLSVQAILAERLF